MGSIALLPGKGLSLLTLGYKASAEQFGPSELLDFSVLAEEDVSLAGAT